MPKYCSDRAVRAKSEHGSNEECPLLTIFNFKRRTHTGAFLKWLPDILIVGIQRFLLVCEVS